MGDGFWVRLRQRKLVQWAVAYVAAAFAFIQGLDVVVQRFGWPDRIEKLVILVLAIGFFVALVLAWYHGERGAQKVGGAELLIIALLLAIGGGALWAYARSPQVATKPLAAAAPQSVVPNAAAVSASVAPSASAPEKSVAVLPFANEGEKSEQFFSDGLSEDLITALSQFAGLKVISRNSAFQFRDSKDTSAKIGKLLGVAHLLEGSVQRAGDKVRITATLVNASDGTVLWTQRYDRPYKDLFALQDEITHSVADALKAKLLTAPGAVVQSDRPPSGNLAAYAAYQRGIAYNAQITEVSLRQAIAAFDDAVRLDPRYAVAYARLSLDWAGLAVQYLSGSAQRQAYSKARDANRTALALDPNLALAHNVRGNLLLTIDFNWSGAQAAYRRALQLAPQDGGVAFSLGNLDATLGQVQRAVALTRKALAADPLHTAWYSWLSSYLTGLGHLDEAEQAIRQALALQPAADASHEQLTVVAILRGQPEAALAAARRETDPNWQRVALALALQISHDHKAADASLQSLIDKNADNAPFQIAEVYALRRDPDNMFEWLERAWVARDPGIQTLLMDPFILRYHDDPRFAAFCRKVGLPTTTDAVAMK